MIIEKVCTGRDKSLYKCDRCGCRLKEGENVRYKITIVKMPVKKGGDNRRNYDLCDRCCYIIDKLIRKGVERWNIYIMLRKDQYVNIENGAKEIRLSKNESRLLEVLLNREVNSYESIIKYVYKDKKGTRTMISLVKSHLLKKIDLDIKTIYDKGLVLREKVFIM